MHHGCGMLSYILLALHELCKDAIHGATFVHLPCKIFSCLSFGVLESLVGSQLNHEPDHLLIALGNSLMQGELGATKETLLLGVHVTKPISLAPRTHLFLR